MKKLVSVLLSLLMLVTVFSALAEENPDLLNANIQFVKDFLDSREYRYRQEGDNNEIFVLDFELTGTYSPAHLYLTVYDDGVQCEACCGVTARGEALMEVCRYLSYVNSTKRYTVFYVDQYNEIWTTNFCFSQDGQMDEKLFGYCYTGVLYQWEDYSAAISDIINNGKTAQELMGK